MNPSPDCQKALIERLTALNALSTAAMQDTNVAARQLSASDPAQAHLWLRITVRSFFTYVEAITFFMRDTRDIGIYWVR